MAVYTRTQTRTDTSSLPNLPSVDLGTVLVKSLQTSLDSLETGNSENLPSKIAEGINLSVIGNRETSLARTNDNQKKNNDVDNLIKNEKNLFEKKKQFETNSEKQRKKNDGNFFKKLDEFQFNLSKTMDTTIKNVSTFVNNPLEGINNVLEGTLKGAVGMVDKIMNTTIGGKSNKDKQAQDTSAKIVAVDKRVSIVNDSIESLIEENKDNSVKLLDKIQDLRDDEKQREIKQKENRNADIKEGAVKEKKRAKPADDINAGIAKTNLTIAGVVTKIGLIALGIAALAVLIPVAFGAIGDFLIKAGEWGKKLLNISLPSLIDNLASHFTLLMDNAKVFIENFFNATFGGLKIALTDALSHLQKDKDKALQMRAEARGITVEEMQYLDEYSKGNKWTEKTDKEVQKLEKQRTKEQTSYDKYLDRIMKNRKVSSRDELVTVLTQQGDLDTLAEIQRRETKLQDLTKQIETKSSRIEGRTDTEEYKRYSEIMDKVNKRTQGMSAEEIQERLQENEEKRLSGLDEKKAQHEVDYAIKNAHGGELRSMLSSDRYTDEQKEAIKLRLEQTHGQGKEFTWLERQTAAGKYVGNVASDTIGEFHHNVFESTKTPYEKKGNVVTVNNQVVEVNNRYRQSVGN